MAKTFYVSPGRSYTVTAAEGTTITYPGITTPAATVDASGSVTFNCTGTEITVSDDSAQIAQNFNNAGSVILGGGEGSGGGESITLDAVPTSGSTNGVTSGGVFDADLHQSLGNSSVALGKDATAYNALSTALGEGAVTGARYAFDRPQETPIIVSQDKTNIDSMSIPSCSVAVGFHAAAYGHNNSAFGVYSKAGNAANTFNGNSATASGYNAAAVGFNATAIGANTRADKSYATAIGHGALAQGDGASASGYAAKASGNSSTASGYNADASGDGAMASGPYTTASGFYSAAYGISANASEAYATANGPHAVASAESATANGTYAAASGTYAIASGAYAIASGNGSGAMGAMARNSNDGCTVISSLAADSFSSCGVDNGQVTQLYLIAAGSPLSIQYCGGEAGLGYVTTTKGVQTYDSDWSIVASGTKKLSELLTDNKDTFAPSMTQERATS